MLYIYVYIYIYIHNYYILFITVCSFWSPMWVCVFNTEGLSFFRVPLISKKTRFSKYLGIDDAYLFQSLRRFVVANCDAAE